MYRQVSRSDLLVNMVDKQGEGAAGNDYYSPLTTMVWDEFTNFMDRKPDSQHVSVGGWALA